MGRRRSVHCVVAGSPISHSLTPLLSLLVDYHLNGSNDRLISAISKYETEDMSSLLGQIVLGGNLDVTSPSSQLLNLVENATNEIVDHPNGWGVNAIEIDESTIVEHPFGEKPLLWVSLTTPLKLSLIHI